MHRIVALPVLLAVVLLGGAGALAQPAGGLNAPRIGIGTIGPASLPADLRIRLEDAAATGLKASGAEVMTAAELARARGAAALGSCSDLLCEQRLAQVTDTRYWLRGTCQLDTSTYRLHLELVDARSGAVVVARDDTCDICTEADAAETASVAASALKAALGRAPTAASPVAAVAPAAATTREMATASDPEQHKGTPAVITPVPAGVDNDRPLWRRALPWVAFAAAAGAAAGGIYYLAINNEGFQCKGMPTTNCRIYNDTLWGQAVPLLAVSAALIASGVVLLTMGGPADRDAPNAAQRSPAPQAKLAITPAGVSLFGSF
ncbi:MAG: hypothetical protein ABIS92_03270 [Polyangia bacterium]